MLKRYASILEFEWYEQPVRIVDPDTFSLCEHLLERVRFGEFLASYLNTSFQIVNIYKIDRTIRRGLNAHMPFFFIPNELSRSKIPGNKAGLLPVPAASHGIHNTVGKFDGCGIRMGNIKTWSRRIGVYLAITRILLTPHEQANECERTN